MQSWKILSRKSILERRWLAISEQRVELPNGTIIDEFHVLDCPSWSAVIAVTPSHQLVLVEQYRHGLGRTSLELPAGVIDPGEQPRDSAIRELREETGYAAQRWQSLVELAPEPSRATHRAHFFVASDAHLLGAAQPEASEVIRVKLIPVDAVFDYIDSGEIVHAAHVAAILLAARRGLLGTTAG